MGFPATGRHEDADLVLVGRPSIHDRDDPPAVHDGDAVGQLEDLVELRRDQEGGRPGVTLGDHLAMDELDAADVQSASRLVEDEQLQVALELARDHDLLLIAARQRRRRRLADGVRMSKALIRSSAVRSMAWSLRRMPRLYGGR